MQAYAAQMQMAYGAAGPYGAPAGGGAMGMGMPMSPVAGMQVGGLLAGCCNGVRQAAAAALVLVRPPAGAWLCSCWTHLCRPHRPTHHPPLLLRPLRTLCRLAAS